MAMSASVAALPTAADGLDAAQPQHSSGYITMRDGVRLKYSLDLPATGSTHPVALIYDVYAESAGALQGNDVRIANALLDDGFAVLGVNVRGTGCSEGTFDMRSPTESLDGAEVVEWAADQSWSTGRVGMFGLSYPGLSQPRIAALRPHGLAAIAPFQIVDDVYRDVGYPGGNLQHRVRVVLGDVRPAVNRTDRERRRGRRRRHRLCDGGRPKRPG
jgi:putative CocE/NonD family hydrolase